MKKIFMSVFLACLLMVPFLGRASSVSNFEFNQVVTADYFYSSTFDDLVLDFTLTSAENDTLKTLVIRNEGSARINYEIEKVVLWTDNGNNQFDGFATDNKIAEASYDSSNEVWVFNNLNVAIPSALVRFFVSIETRRSGTNNRTFQFSIPAHQDVNNNKQYEIGDTGTFLSSYEEYPTIKEINETIANFRYSSDAYNPVSVFTNLIDKQIIAGTNYTITGQSKDQGGSSPDTVQICLDSICSSVTSMADYFSAWEYQWTNIAEGEHTIYLKTADFNGNLGQTKTITITKQLPKEEAKVEEVKEEKKVEEVKKEEIKEIQKEIKEVFVRDLNKERKAIGVFGRIYGRLPSLTNDWQFVSFLAYNSLPQTRNLDEERKAIGVFGRVYGRLPFESYDWNIVRGLAYK